MNRIVLAALLVALCHAAQAMEQMADDALSDSVGQSGMTVDVSPVTVTAQHIRYYDGDGFSSLPYGASVDVADFSLSLTANTYVHLDVGSTGTGASDHTALLVAVGPISGMSITTGNISTDSGNELAAGVNTVNFAKIAITNITISGIDAMISQGGAHYSSGLTFTTLAPVSMSAGLAVTDVADGGVLSAQLAVSSLLVGGATVDVMPTGQGIALGAGNSTMENLSLSDVRVGSSAFSGSDMGTVSMHGLNFTGTTVSVTGH